MTKVAIVNYLNTKPFIFGLNQPFFRKDFEVFEIMPSLCAQWYLEKKVDIALVPVGALATFPVNMINDLGIACDGPVASVCLFSQVPIGKIKRVILDYQSRTSVTLAKILLEDHWSLKPLFQPGYEGFESDIVGETAGLIIGDRAILLKSKFEYVYDLGEAWKNLTGFPFVFAVWLKNGILSNSVIEHFNQGLQYGLDHLPELLPIIDGYPSDFLTTYFSQNIKYHLRPEYLMGMKVFFEKRKNPEALPLALNAVN